MCQRKWGGLRSFENFLEDSEGKGQKGYGERPFSPKGTFFSKGSGVDIPPWPNYILVPHKGQCVKKGKEFSKF
tara:strand:- start:278 stop:496 length:219 start_codon:yes stop_codon:yes gene_type:complete